MTYHFLSFLLWASDLLMFSIIANSQQMKYIVLFSLLISLLYFSYLEVISILRLLLDLDLVMCSYFCYACSLSEV